MLALGTLIEGLILGRIWGLLGMGGTTTHGLGGGGGGGAVGGGLRSSFEVECKLHTPERNVLCFVLAEILSVYAIAYIFTRIFSFIF